MGSAGRLDVTAESSWYPVPPRLGTMPRFSTLVRCGQAGAPLRHGQYGEALLALFIIMIAGGNSIND